jgi:alpha-aminoadipate carrier protein LysW
MGTEAHPLMVRRSDAMADAECPECAGKIPLAANTEVGEILSCPDCGSRLEVRGVNPPSLAQAPKVEEDWGE